MKLKPKVEFDREKLIELLIKTQNCDYFELADAIINAKDEVLKDTQ